MTAIPDGFPSSPEYWYGRWLAAQEQLDEEGAQRIAGWPRAAAAERERIRQLALAEADRGRKTGLDRIALRAFAQRLGAAESTATCEQRPASQAGDGPAR